MAGGGGGGGGSGGSLVDESYQFVRSIPAPSDTDHIDITGLDGDSDGIYILVMNILNKSGAPVNYQMWPNGSNPGGNALNDEHLIGIGNTPLSGLDNNIGRIGASGGNNQWVGIHTFLYAKSGRNRWARSHDVRTGTAIASSMYMWSWSDTTTELSSLKIIGSTDDINPVADSIGAGSEILIYKLRTA